MADSHMSLVYTTKSERTAVEGNKWLLFSSRLAGDDCNSASDLYQVYIR